MVGILRVLNNVLEGILPKTSIHTPNEIDLYSMEEFLSSSQQFGDESKEGNNDLTSMERAFIASRIAEQNKIEAEMKNDKVCHQYYDFSGKTKPKRAKNPPKTPLTTQNKH